MQPNPDGTRKTFERFLNDVQTIDRTYNRRYLKAEYDLAHSSAIMAARWEEIVGDGDRYLLQYRTAGDAKVRPDHAALNGITLPPSDPFWQSFFPPNSWGCRCQAVQVRRGKYPLSDHNDAMKLGEQALAKDKKGIFRFNPGQQRTAFPDNNPYTISKCRNCNMAKGKAQLTKHFIPDNELCEACAIFRKCAGDREKTQRAIERTHYLHEMEPLLKRHEILKTEEKDIRVGFTIYGNKHLFSDTFGRSSVLTKDDLSSLDKVLKDAVFIESSPLTHQRTDGIDRFFYYESEIRGKKVRLNVARRIKTRNNGKQQYDYFLYSINDIQKSTSGGG